MHKSVNMTRTTKKSTRSTSAGGHKAQTVTVNTKELAVLSEDACAAPSGAAPSGSPSGAPRGATGGAAPSGAATSGATEQATLAGIDALGNDQQIPPMSDFAHK